MRHLETTEPPEIVSEGLVYRGHHCNRPLPPPHLDSPPCRIPAAVEKLEAEGTEDQGVALDQTPRMEARL